MESSLLPPRVIFRYYIEAVEQQLSLSILIYWAIIRYNLFIFVVVISCSGCPSVLRSDYGTENAILAAIQIAFRYIHSDHMAREKSFVYGPVFFVHFTHAHS